MAKTVIDVDDELLAIASEVLGTTTKKDTVNGALAEIVKRKQRSDLIEWLATDPLPDLRDPQVMGRAWRQ